MICDCVRYTTQEGLDGWFDASRFVSCERVGDVTAIMLELSRGTIILTAKESSVRTAQLAASHWGAPEDGL